LFAAAIEPGAVASEVARAAGIHTSQLFRCGRSCAVVRRAAPGFSAVAVVSSAGAARTCAVPPAAAIEIEFADRHAVRITGAADASTVRAMIGALAKVEQADDPAPE